jgi:fructoselysine 6-phosphate deglycase
MDVRNIVADIKTKVDSTGGLKMVYFVGCGGSRAAIYPGKYLLASQAKTFGVGLYTSNEFVHAPPAALDGRCVCVVCSLKATPETVEALELANSKGALTIAMTGNPDTLMAKGGAYPLIYSNGDEQVYSEANQAMSLRIGFEILAQFEGYGDYAKAMEAFGKIDGIVERAKESIKPLGVDFARKYADEPLFYVMASGPNYGSAYSMASCHLMEMQWKHAVVVHTGEYFHGPFETTDKDLPIILLMSEGRTRPLDERCLSFLKKYAAKVTVIDPRDMGLNAVDGAVVEFFNPIIMIPIERYIVSLLAEHRKHPMTQRRYMWKVAY